MYSQCLDVAVTCTVRSLSVILKHCRSFNAALSAYLDNKALRSYSFVALTCLNLLLNTTFIPSYSLLFRGAHRNLKFFRVSCVLPASQSVVAQPRVPPKNGETLKFLTYK